MAGVCLNIGARIRQLREEQGMSQTDIEEKTGIQRVSISQYENGHKIPSLETLERIATGLEIQMYRFFYTGKRTPKG